MPLPKHLKNAPILEAIVDIQGTPQDPIERDNFLKILKDSQGGLPSEFSVVEEMAERELRIFQEGDPTVSAVVLGYKFSAKGSPTKIIQCRMNGYTFSWLTPYNNWESLIQGAQHGWNAFRTRLPTFRINRLAVRFINQVEIPLPLTNSNEYLAEIPRPLTSPGDMTGLREFAEQMISVDSESSATVGLIRVIQNPQIPSATKTRAIIDIDVYRKVEAIGADDPQIWHILSTFRDVKNRVFFKCIGESIIKACGG